MISKIFKFILSIDKRKVILIFNWLYWLFKAASEIFGAGEEMIKTYGRYLEDVEKENKKSTKSKKSKEKPK